MCTVNCRPTVSNYQLYHSATVAPIVAYQKSAVNNSNKMVDQNFSVQISERSQGGSAATPQSQVVHNDANTSHNLNSTLAAPYMAATNSSSVVCQPSTQKLSIHMICGA